MGLLNPCKAKACNVEVWHSVSACWSLLVGQTETYQTQYGPKPSEENKVERLLLDERRDNGLFQSRFPIRFGSSLLFGERYIVCLHAVTLPVTDQQVTPDDESTTSRYFAAEAVVVASPTQI